MSVMLVQRKNRPKKSPTVHWHKTYKPCFLGRKALFWFTVTERDCYCRRLGSWQGRYGDRNRSLVAMSHLPSESSEQELSDLKAWSQSLTSSSRVLLPKAPTTLSNRDTSCRPTQDTSHSNHTIHSNFWFQQAGDWDRRVQRQPG